MQLAVSPAFRAARCISAVALATTLLVPFSQAQVATPIARWAVRTDAGGASNEVRLSESKPGFRVTTGPATILFDGTMRAQGTWRLEATLHLFDPGARAEGFGVIFGGRDLTGPNPQYAYALVRRDGKALLKVREGATTRTVRDWAANGAIPLWKPSVPGASVRYPLVVEASADRVSLWVGGTKVLDAPRSEVPTDGVVGLRINHALDIRVERISVASVTLR